MFFMRFWFIARHRKNMRQLKEVLQMLQQCQFFANGKKCGFGRHEMQYLGNVIS